MRTYTFADLQKYSGASGSELKHWVQSGVIRPDVRETTGTGKHRTFGFLDVVEATIAQRLNQLPGGMPIVPLALALDRVRFETALVGQPWRLFHDPETRDPAARFWLCQSRRTIWELLTEPARATWWATTTEAVISLPLHNLLLTLEARTEDHASDEECVRAWTKEKPRSRQRRDAVVGSAVEGRR